MLSSFLRLLTVSWDAIGLLLLVVLFTEFGIDPLRRFIRRLRSYARGRPVTDGLSTDDAPITYHDNVAKQGLDWAPYVHWRQRPYLGPHTSIDARGLRVTIGANKNSSAAVRIFCFGGSTLFGLGVRNASTIPSIMQQRLDDLGLDVSVTNHAQLAYNSSQDLLALQNLLKREDTPDVVVFYDGFNDVFTAEWTGRADVIRGEEKRRAEFMLLGTERRYDLVRAALAGALPRSFRRIRELTKNRWARDSSNSPRVRIDKAKIGELAHDVISVYAANVRTARALANEYGFSTVFVWEPMLATKKVKTTFEQQIAKDRELGPELRAEIYSTIVAEYRRHPVFRGASDVVDLSALFDDREETIYIDFAHLTEAAIADVVEAMLAPVAKAVMAVTKTGH